MTQSAKSQEFSNVRALQIFERKVLFSLLNRRTIFDRDLRSSDSVAKFATQKPWVFWDWTNREKLYVLHQVSYSKVDIFLVQIWQRYKICGRYCCVPSINLYSCENLKYKVGMSLDLLSADQDTKVVWSLGLFNWHFAHCIWSVKIPVYLLRGSRVICSVVLESLVLETSNNVLDILFGTGKAHRLS